MPVNYVRWLAALGDALFLFAILIALPLFAYPVLRHVCPSCDSQFGDRIPTVGARKGETFGKLRAAVRQLTDGVRTLSEGYSTFSKHGVPFLTTDVSLKQELLLPPSLIRWFSEQPDTVLSSAEVRGERHAANYLHFATDYGSVCYFLHHVAGDSLSRKLEDMFPIVVEELKRGVDKTFAARTRDGRNHDYGDADVGDKWRKVKVYAAMQEIIFPAITRVFLGRALARDRSFLASFRGYIVTMGISTLVVGQLPRMLKPIIAPFFNLPLRYYRWLCMRRIVPIVAAQMARENETGKFCSRGSRVGDGDKDGAMQEKNEFLIQVAELSLRNTVLRDKGQHPRVLAEWMMLLSFAALSSTVTQASHTLIDIISPSAQRRHALRGSGQHPDPDIYTALRVEADAQASSTRLDTFSPQNYYGDNVVHLPTFDSAIRESLRLHPILIKGLSRSVVKSEGLNIPLRARIDSHNKYDSEGKHIHVPRGAWLGIPIRNIHLDERHYANPETYDGFRTLRERQARHRLQESSRRQVSHGSINTEPENERGNEYDLDADYPTPTYLAFGYGRHTCPGRSLAVQLLKSLFAQIVLKYDIEPVRADTDRRYHRSNDTDASSFGNMTPTSVIGDVALPPVFAECTVRRRRREHEGGEEVCQEGMRCLVDRREN